jgi:hypothetical protein
MAACRGEDGPAVPLPLPRSPPPHGAAHEPTQAHVHSGQQDAKNFAAFTSAVAAAVPTFTASSWATCTNEPMGSPRNVKPTGLP